MIKKIFLVLIAVSFLAYFVFVILYVNPKANNELCSNMEITVVDTLDRHLIKDKEIAVILKNTKLTPVGKKMSEIDSKTIESKLKENKLIKKAECYKTTNGTVKIEIYQKIPILRIFSTKDGSYYIDMEGEIMPLSGNYPAYLPVATGNIEKEFAKTKLYDFALFLQNNKYWNAQIEQINIAFNNDMELIPRVGNFLIVLGKPDDYSEKLEKLKLFYEKGLNEVGWNRYSVINLKYKNQVVCTKK
jgi:cell division protein FtsQ